MAAALTACVTLVEVPGGCPRCGVPFAIPSHLLDQRQRNAGDLFCPSGHAMSWKETEADRLKKIVEERDRQLAAETKKREWAEQAAKKAEQAAAATKRRAAHGVCPCCKRSFANVRRHMATKHPKEIETTGKLP